MGGEKSPPIRFLRIMAADDILERLPAKTPNWSVGVVSIVIAVGSMFLAIYSMTRPEVHDFLQSRSTQEVAEQTFHESMVGGMMKLIVENQKSIGTLSQSIQDMERINEKNRLDITDLQKKLSDCQTGLSKNKGY